MYKIKSHKRILFSTKILYIIIVLLYIIFLTKNFNILKKLIKFLFEYIELKLRLLIILFTDEDRIVRLIKVLKNGIK